MGFRRWAGVAGLAFVALFAAGQVMAGSLPQPNEFGEQVVAYFGEHADTLQIAVALTGAGVFLGVLFLAGLFDATRQVGDPRAEPWSVVGLIGGAGALLGNAVQAAVFGALGITIKTTSSPDLTVLVYRAAFTLGGATAVFAALFLLGFVLASWKTALLPTWVRWLGLLAAALQAFSGIGIASARGIFFISTLAAFVASLLWVAAASVVLLRSSMERSSA